MSFRLNIKSKHLFVVHLVSFLGMLVHTRDDRSESIFGNWRVEGKVSIKIGAISYHINQYLSGHGNFLDKLRKFSVVKTKYCKCGQIYSLEHTLL